MRKKRTIRVVYTKIITNWGYSTGKFKIEIDKTLKGRKLLEILLHECVHELWPEATEEEVEYKSAVLARTLWAQGFREKIVSDGKNKMQDEIPAKP